MRWEYSKLWLSILNKNKDKMKLHCDQLGVGDLYALFSCMVSGRTWDAIESGLDQTKFTLREVSSKCRPTLTTTFCAFLEKAKYILNLDLKDY